MCGIAGVWLRKGDDAVARTLALSRALVMYGREGTGVAWVEDGRIKVVKDTVSPLKFTPPEAKAKVAISHNRLPSVGRISLQNCHPFLSCDERFAVVHNGTFLHYRLVRTLLNGVHKIQGETDAEVITHMLCDRADQVGWIKLLQVLDGQRLIILFRDGSIMAKGCILYQLEKRAGWAIVNYEEGLSGLPEGNTIYRCEDNTVSVIDAKGKLTHYGKVVRDTYRKRRTWSTWRESYGLYNWDEDRRCVSCGAKLEKWEKELCWACEEELWRGNRWRKW